MKLRSVFLGPEGEVCQVSPWPTWCEGAESGQGCSTRELACAGLSIPKKQETIS